MDDASSSDGRAGSSSSSSSKLQRRLMALPRRHWTLDADYELIRHISPMTSLSDVAPLSDCLKRMAEHTVFLQREEQHILCAKLLNTAVLQHLYKVTSCVLQQVAQHLQQFMQQGQLPAALTVHAVEACNALCVALGTIHQYAKNPGIEVQLEVRKQLCALMHSTGWASVQTLA
jgi:hypothetical protein